MTATTLAPAWSDELTEVFTSSLVCEYATLTRQGRPVTWPVTPYLGGRTLDVSTGLTYPLKAERARANPRVALSYSDPAGYASGSGSTARPGRLSRRASSERITSTRARPRTPPSRSSPRRRPVHRPTPCRPGSGT